MAISETNAILAGSFLARVTYGGASNGDAADGLNYDYDYQEYVNRFDLEDGTAGWHLLTGAELNPHLSASPLVNAQGSALNFELKETGLYLAFNSDVINGAEALFAETTIAGERTLVLAFRGSDGVDAAFQRQTFSPVGIERHYESLKPLIDAAYGFISQANQDGGADNIQNLVVSGHSLGGAMADVFVLADAKRFESIPDLNLKVVSLASPGIDPQLPRLFDGGDNPFRGNFNFYEKTLDTEYATVTNGVITSIDAPTYHISISHVRDRVNQPSIDLLTDEEGDKNFPLNNLFGGLTFNNPLVKNLPFSQTQDLPINVPNIQNTDVLYDRKIDNHGFGALHNDQLYWANIEGLLNDPLYSDYSSQKIQVGITNYSGVPDTPPGALMEGDPIAILKDYIHNPSDDTFPIFGDYDSGEKKALSGDPRADYILGLTGSDSIEGFGGDDLLSGGDGNESGLNNSQSIESVR